MKHIKTLKIDIDKKNFEVIPSVQYDSNTRFLHIQLLNNSVPCDITGCSVILSGVKEDGTSIFNSCDVINPEIAFIQAEITEQMNVIPGLIDCEIKIYDGEGVLTSKKFTIKVTASQTSRSVVSSNEFKALTDALNKVQAIDNKAEKAEVEKLSSQLDTKANDSEVRKTNVNITLNDCDSNLLGAINGSATFKLLSIPRDLSVSYQKLENGIQSILNVNYSPISLTWHSCSYYNYTDGVITVGDANYNYADVVNVTAGEKFMISGQSKWAANLYVITDNNGIVLDAFPNQNIKQTYNDIIFEIPSNGAKLLVNKTDGIATSLYKLVSYKVKGDYISDDSIEGKSIKNNVINYEKLDNKIQNVFSETYETLTLTWHSGGYYDYRYGSIVADSDTTYNYADVVNVTAGEKFMISGSSRWYAGLYTITDNSGNILETFPNAFETGTTYSDVEFIIPNNGTKLLINKTQGVETVLKKVDGYSLVANKINKKWVAFGDSLTDSYTLGNESNYTNFIADSLGLTLVNCGKGGTGYINNNGGTQQFYNRTSQIPNDTELLTVFGSFNDLYLDNIPIGSITDTEPTSLYGAINKFLSNCWNINPSMIIGIISPTPWHNWWRGHSDTSRANKCVEYVQVLKTVAEYYSLPFLDLFSCSNLRPWEQRIKDLYYLNADGVHPNSLGHEKYIVPKVESFIKSIIQ